MIYDKIKQLCKEKHLSVSAVERLAGLGNGTISKWNSVSPAVVNVLKVADVLDCTMDELLQSEESCAEQ